MAARHRSIHLSNADERSLADGEAVWSWRPDAGAKLVMMPTHHTGDGGNKARSPGRARSKPLKPLRREGRISPVSPVVTTLVCFLPCTRGRGCQPASGLPCALSFKKGITHMKGSGNTGRENMAACFVLGRLAV